MHRRWNLLPAIALLATATLGCGGGGDTRQPAEASASSDAQVAEPTVQPFDSVGLGDDFAGTWTITLLPEAADAGVEPPTVEAIFTSDGGTVGGANVEDLQTDANASPVPTVSFTTSEIQYVGVSGDDVVVGGPINWTGGLYDGGDTISGTATGPNGVASAWEATRR